MPDKIDNRKEGNWDRQGKHGKMHLQTDHKRRVE